MAKKLLTATCYIIINGEPVLWYTHDPNTGESEYFLPDEVTAPLKKKMMENVGKAMSGYYTDKLNGGF